MRYIQAIAMCAVATAADTQPDIRDADDGASYLYVWAGDREGRESDFLAVIDACAGQPAYGAVIATLPVCSTGSMPHHTQYEYPQSDILFADGWLASRTFVIDLNDPASPRLKGSFDEALGYSYPHSYAPLDNGNILATFQGRDGEYGAPGGLVELTLDGTPVRAASAVAAGVEPGNA